MPTPEPFKVVGSAVHMIASPQSGLYPIRYRVVQGRILLVVGYNPILPHRRVTHYDLEYFFFSTTNLSTNQRAISHPDDVLTLTFVYAFTLRTRYTIIHRDIQHFYQLPGTTVRSPVTTTPHPVF